MLRTEHSGTVDCGSNGLDQTGIVVHFPKREKNASDRANFWVDAFRFFRSCMIRMSGSVDPPRRRIIRMANVWADVLTDIRSQVRPEAYNTWFRPIHCTHAVGTKVILAVPEDFYLDWFQDNYVGLLRDVLRNHLGESPSLEFEQRASSQSLTEIPVEESSNLDDKYTFDTFIVGDSNRFAHAAAKGVAHNPGGAYNPLFIYARVGLGKTHLLHAIGREILQRDSKARVRYVTCETFVNDVVQMLAKGQDSDGFRSLYRGSCDVLLVDDIQFLGGKEKSQIEFFNVFNALYGMRRQIVMTCDRYPKDIPKLEQRLQSRFQWGLVVDIDQPDLETRVAILRCKAEDLNFHLPQDVAMFIATYIKSNVRELEGSLMRLRAYIELTGAELTQDIARLALGNLLMDAGSRLTAERIIQTVSNYYNVSVKEILGESRKRTITTPRHVAMYLAKTLTNASYPTLGERFGGRDHTTVLSACQKIERVRRDESSDLAQDVSRLHEILED
jgi:chromosomal replication initiator protein